MAQKKSLSLGVAVVTAAALAQPALSGGNSVGGVLPVFVPPTFTGPPTNGQPAPQSPTPTQPTTPTTQATPEATTQVVQSVAAASLFCGAIAQQEYAVDCLSERLDSIAQGLPADGDYAEAREAFDEASRSLAALAKANQSSDLPVGRAANNNTTTSRPLVPVDSAALDDTAAAALAIVEELETKLLRSAANSQRRAVHYTRIADAIGSNKVLLRSL